MTFVYLVESFFGGNLTKVGVSSDLPCKLVKRYSNYYGSKTFVHTFPTSSEKNAGELENQFMKVFNLNNRLFVSDVSKFRKCHNYLSENIDVPWGMLCCTNDDIIYNISEKQITDDLVVYDTLNLVTSPNVHVVYLTLSKFDGVVVGECFRGYYGDNTEVYTVYLGQQSKDFYNQMVNEFRGSNVGGNLYRKENLDEYIRFMNRNPVIYNRIDDGFRGLNVSKRNT